MRKLDLSLSLTSAAMAVRSAFKIASVNPVLWWDAESHRAGLAGGAATLFQDAAGTSAVTAVEQPVGLVRSMANAGPRRNLLTYSEQFENAAWVLEAAATLQTNTPNTVAPDETNNADAIVSNSTTRAELFRSISYTAGQQYTLSVYAKAGAGSNNWVSFGTNGPTSSLCVWFDLNSGVIGNQGSGHAGSIISVGGGWYRLSVTVTGGVGTNPYFDLSPVSANGISTPISGQTTFLWGAQLERGSVASDYQKITSGVEYLDALQATSTARPVLTARKNLLTYSEQFDNASWNAGGCVAVGSILTEIAGAGQHRIQKSIASTSGAVYSISCEVERVGGSRHFMLDLSSGTNGYCYFDLSNGTHLLLGSGMSDVSVVGVGAGKYKISANFTTTAAALSIYVAMCLAKAGGAETYVADGSGVLSVKNLQVELGTTATSYQRVTTATDYDTTSAPLMLQFDGVDDALSTGTFAAGTLPADADVYMVVKRDPGDGPSILIGNSWAKYVGIPDSTIDPQGPLDSGAGSTFQYVNGVPVTTRVQQDELLGSDLALFSANGCDLSTWTGLTVGNSVYGSYRLTGSIGAVLITPAQSDATRAKIRKALAKAYQITGVV